MVEDKKWQLAFWITTVFLVGGLSIISTNVIANDRIRAQEDTRIFDVLSSKMESMLKENSFEHRSIMMDLREIKTSMGIKDNGRTGLS